MQNRQWRINWTGVPCVKCPTSYRGLVGEAALVAKLHGVEEQSFAYLTACSQVKRRDQFATMITKTIARTAKCRARKSREGMSRRVITRPFATSVPGPRTDVQFQAGAQAGLRSDAPQKPFNSEGEWGRTLPLACRAWVRGGDARVVLANRHSVG
jgi:hypothetical protein